MAADIEIDYGATPRWDAVRAQAPYRVASADLFEIAMPGLARFTCLDRRRIVIDPVPGWDRDHLADMLIATVLPALLWARGEIVLHAAAFVLPDASRAIAIAGPSGSGKSTALARAVAMGGSVVADDSIRVRVEGGEAVVTGLAGGWFERTGDAARAFRAMPPPHHRADRPLGMLAVLTPAVTLPRRLVGAEALAALLRQRHRSRIAALLGTEPALLPVIAAIARSVPIVAVPMDPANPLLAYVGEAG